jgi:hypothetical protein
LQSEVEVAFSEFAKMKQKWMEGSESIFPDPEGLMNLMYHATKGQGNLFMSLSLLETKIQAESGVVHAPQNKPKRVSPVPICKNDFVDLTTQMASSRKEQQASLVADLSKLFSAGEGEVDVKSKLRAELKELNELLQIETELSIVSKIKERKLQVADELFANLKKCNTTSIHANVNFNEHVMICCLLCLFSIYE